MAIGKLKRTQEPAKKDIEAFILKGGTTAEEKGKKDEVRMTFRCPKDLIDKLDSLRKNRAGRVTRNQALIEAVELFVKGREFRKLMKDNT